MKDGLYRRITKEGTNYDIVEVEDDSVCNPGLSVFDSDPVEKYLKEGYRFIPVRDVHLPDDMWEEIHSEALAASIADEDVIEAAVRNFFIYFRPAPEYRKAMRVKNED